MESQMISVDRIPGPCFKKYMHKLLLVQSSIFKTTIYIYKETTWLPHIHSSMIIKVDPRSPLSARS